MSTPLFTPLVKDQRCVLQLLSFQGSKILYERMFSILISYVSVDKIPWPVLSSMGWSWVGDRWVSSQDKPLWTCVVAIEWRTKGKHIAAIVCTIFRSVCFMLSDNDSVTKMVWCLPVFEHLVVWLSTFSYALYMGSQWQCSPVSTCVPLMCL